MWMGRCYTCSLFGLLFVSPHADADDLGQRKLFDNLTFYAQTSGSNGGEADAATAPKYRVYEDGSFMFEDDMVQTDATNTDGYYSATMQLSPSNGFDPGKQYSIRFRGTVSSVNKADFHTFTIHPTEIFVQHDGNNASSGTTAESRIENAPSRTVVALGPGVFDIGLHTQIVIPTNVSVRGAGIGATQITKSGSGVCVVPGDRSVVEGLTIDASAAGQGYGSDGTQQFDDALLRHAQVKGDQDAVYISGTGASALTMEGVWLETDFDGMIVGDAAHRVLMRDVFLKAALESFPQGISVASSAEVRGMRVNIDITIGAGPIGISLNDSALVELFDSGIWVDPSVTVPISINLASSNAKSRVVNCEFDRSLMVGQTQQISDVYSSLRPSLLTSATIDSLASQSQFTLTTGPPDNNAINGRLIVITDNLNGTRKAVGVVSMYVGSTRQVTLAADPGIFTMARRDEVDVVVEAQ
jgi:hypothetical protein